MHLALATKMDYECNRNIGNHSSSTSLVILENEIADLQENAPQHSVTAVLCYCKRKILNPYLRLLSIIGLRPLIPEQQEPSICIDFINYIYIIQVFILMGLGYLLQYMACLRRDRGFCYKISDHIKNDSLLYDEEKLLYEQICHGSVIFTFIVPSGLLFIGFLHSFFVFRNSDDDHLPVLMERVFLSSNNLVNGFTSQKSLVKKLWTFVIISIIWILLSLFAVNFMLIEGKINFKWMEKRTQVVLITCKVLLIICTLWHDIVQATIITNYCLQAQLLTSYVQFIRENLLQYPVEPLEWMRGIEEFKKMLKYFNEDIAPSVCIFTIVNVSYAISGILWLFDFDRVDRETLPIYGISVLNVVLWVLISIAPFFQAVRLSSACNILKEVGQELRIRPFVHQGTPIHELNSVLLYTTSLNINAKLFYLPITGTYVCFFLTLLAVSILVLGQCHYLN